LSFTIQKPKICDSLADEEAVEPAGLPTILDIVSYREGGRGRVRVGPKFKRYGVLIMYVLVSKLVLFNERTLSLNGTRTDMLIISTFTFILLPSQTYSIFVSSRTRSSTLSLVKQPQ